MRGFFYVVSALVVMALAFWAYHENYQTQQALREVKQLQRQIGSAREQLGVLRAEWAYLNRPERLRDLAELNFERLQLMPLAPEHFGDVSQVAYPRPVTRFELNRTMDVSTAAAAAEEATR
ncbi:cell division protein FtsL [Maritimibacter sp. 55A14]|uniref:cell division protein FtsL n=1 Tax=Maritimibacter sp. 55A14 TaxID=2174844 RepID=UPI000D60FDA3|nr:cell division protein FtsL [Maritimibacter sp. 55A14]PWE34067.1 cell division protein FtsL [Maritimibacter sp. 55A14]